MTDHQPRGFAGIANAMYRRRLLTQDTNIEDEIRGQADSLSAQAQAAVFVGAIQTQGLASSINDNSTHLKVATNNMFFISIFFSVIGAYYALITAASLEANLNEVKSLLSSRNEQELLEIHHLPLSPLARRFLRHQCHRREPPVNLPEYRQPSGAQPEILAGTTLLNLCSSVKKNKFAGLLSAVVIALAFITCLLAFVFLAWATQPPTVRFTAIAVVGTLLLLPGVVKYKDDLTCSG